MSIEDEVAFLERVPTLRVLGRDALRILAIGAENRYVHEGVTLFKQDEAADSAYVVQEGSFDLVSEGAGAGRPVVVGAGAMIGELALVTESKRISTATAREPSTVIRINRQLFLKMLEGYPDAARRLRDAIAARLNDSTREIVKVRGSLDGTATPRRR